MVYNFYINVRIKLIYRLKINKVIKILIFKMNDIILE